MCGGLVACYWRSDRPDKIVCVQVSSNRGFVGLMLRVLFALRLDLIRNSIGSTLYWRVERELGMNS